MVADLLFSADSSVTALLAWANPVPVVRKGGNRRPVGVFKQGPEHSSCQMTAWHVWKDKSSFLFHKSLKLEVVEATKIPKRTRRREETEAPSSRSHGGNGELATLPGLFEFFLAETFEASV